MRAGGVEACWACGAATPAADAAALGLWRCPACGLRFAAGRSPSELRDLYGDDYYERYAHGEGYEDEAQRSYEARLRTALVRRFIASGDLLEIGSAGGFFLDAARAAGFRVTGVEPAATMAERARRRFGVHVETGFVEDVALPAGAYDVVCAWHVLEHVAQPATALTRVATLLRPGGLLLLEVPNAASRQAQRLGDAWPHWDWPHHVAHYTPAAASALLERGGWSVLDIHTFPGTGYHRPRQAFSPLGLLMQAREAVALRALPRRSHRDRHELLRVAARRPAGVPAA